MQWLADRSSQKFHMFQRHCLKDSETEGSAGTFMPTGQSQASSESWGSRIRGVEAWIWGLAQPLACLKEYCHICERKEFNEMNTKVF